MTSTVHYPYSIRRSKVSMHLHAERLFFENKKLREEVNSLQLELFQYQQQNEVSMEEEKEGKEEKEEELNSLNISLQSELSTARQQHEEMIMKFQKQTQQQEELAQRAGVVVNDYKRLQKLFQREVTTVARVETELATTCEKLSFADRECARLKLDAHYVRPAKHVSQLYWDITLGDLALSQSKRTVRANLRQEIHVFATRICRFFYRGGNELLWREFSLLGYSPSNDGFLKQPFTLLHGVLDYTCKQKIDDLKGPAILQLASALDGVWIYMTLWLSFLRAIMDKTAQTSTNNIGVKPSDFEAYNFSCMCSEYFLLVARVQQWLGVND